jgi:mono/diheme cytochrome c family protein
MVARFSAALLGLVLAAGIVTLASASEPVLTIEMGGTTHRVTREELLRNPAIADIDVARDASYRRAMHYRAIPLERLLAGFEPRRDQTLETVAADGFIGMLPVDLVMHAPSGAAQAFLAIEPADAPWAPLPGREVSAGAFYVVWLRPEAAGIRSEQWPYQVETIRSVDSPGKRWPALSVDPTLRAGDPIRVGQALFIAQCLVCHKLNGAGSADVGPDLNLPESPTEYFQPSALKRYIRDPSSLRHWSNMQMKGFDKEALSDSEIGLVVAYLRHMASRKAKP